MPLTNSLINILKKDFPHFSFVTSDTYYWSFKDKTIYYDSSCENHENLLHEVAHGVLGHQAYQKDISLLKMEREAWQYASNVLAPKYLKKPLSQELIEEALDSYRDWLHARSTCPHCQATGVQNTANSYSCIACQTKWRVNDAKVCALRRYKIT